MLELAGQLTLYLKTVQVGKVFELAGQLVAKRRFVLQLVERQRKLLSMMPEESLPETWVNYQEYSFHRE